MNMKSQGVSVIRRNAMMHGAFTNADCIHSGISIKKGDDDHYGSMHQGDPRFSGNNSQCCAMAAIASCMSVFADRRIENLDIDNILYVGDKLYLQLLPNLPGNETYLMPEELPSEIRVGNFSANIQPMTDNWITNGLFASNGSELDNATKNLIEILQNFVFTADHCDGTDSIIFTGQNYTVSFWRYCNAYYLFNSHAVDCNNRPSDGVARLFKCHTLEMLADYLFARRLFSLDDRNRQYSLHRLRVITSVPSPTFTPSSLESNFVCSPTFTPSQASDSLKLTVTSPEAISIATTTITAQKNYDIKLSYLKPVVVIDLLSNKENEPVVPIQKMISNLSINGNDGNPSVVKKGRPKKQKRGRPSIKNNAHLDAVNKYNTKNPNINREAVNRYTTKKPEIHRDAVRRYTTRNPEINRDAVSRYAAKNPEINREASQRYNSKSRNIEIDLRRSSNLIGEKRDDALDCVRLFSLKKPSLIANDAFQCPHCKARLYEEERGRKQMCCGNGTISIHLSELTEAFYSHPSFLLRPRGYNNMFSFSALGASHGFKNPAGLSFLKIQGRVYHRVFDLSYQQSTNNIGLYINDHNERERLASGLNLDLTVIRSINNFLHNVNPFIECFKRLSREPSDKAYIRFEPTSRETHGNILGDLPIGNEIAALISTERETFAPRCIAVWKVGHSKPHTVDIMHPLYEAFQYPLLYPEGTPGWFPGKLDNTGKKLTQVKYVRCLLLSEPRFSQFGRLSEEWLVDLYCRIAEERLRFIANMQNRNSTIACRTAPLQEINSHIQRDETVLGEGIVPGRIYLPNTFTGSPRYMKVKYMDAIAIVNRLGTPSYLLTFTCNPNWPEIRQSRRSNFAEPLIIVRSFQLRLAQLLRDIRSGCWFGKCIFIFHVIEFQKRGLPHAHICFRVEEGPQHSVDIDKFVRADIPNSSEAGGRLRQMVLNHMIHGPCGPPNRTDLPCWNKDKNKCSKFFPKRESDVTFVDDKGFVNLRRNSKNLATIKYRSREFSISDQWVVPYNAGLLLKYDAHMNIEVSSQRTIVKYLFKYMTKGPDESRVAVIDDEHANDEIEQYVTKRYIGSSDAAWRILEFDITAREPNVKQLAVHLENQHNVYFHPGTEAEAVQRATSDLITYFNRPAGTKFDNLTYLDFYEQYLVHASRPKSKSTIYETANNRFLTERQRGQLVARLFWVAPNRGEQFYLRILLKSFPCRCYADLLKLGGPSCNSFQEAAKIVGLADDEVEYERAMLEASTFFTGPRLRRFFVLLASIGAPVALLWDTFKNQLSEDFLHRLPQQTDLAHNFALIEINRMLSRHGTSVAQYGLPEVTDNTTELGRERVEYNSDRLIAYVDEWLPRLSSDQRVIFDYVKKLCTDDAFRDTENSAIFIDGPAGTGKTLLLNVITAHVRGVLKNVALCTASSAIAAQNYEGGITAHSMFKFPLNLDDDLSFWSITNGSQRAELIFNSQVIIYDEAPMAHKFLIHLLDRSLRDLMRNENVFGNKIIIFAGDFRQIPPVVPNAKTNADILNCSVKTSPIWQKVKSCSLLTSQRCKEDPKFADFLLKLGSNKLETVDNSVDLSLLDHVTEIDDLIKFVFSDVIHQPDNCARRAILSTRNDTAKEINDIILNRLSGQTLHFFSVDKLDSDNVDQVFLGVDALNKMQPKGVPEHDLTLKVGCVCMIIRNLSFADGLVNGTKVIIVKTSPRIITVRKPGGSEDFLIPRIIFKTPVEPNSAFEMCRRQFPLQLSYAMTIHKSQGQTINRVGVDLRSDIFSHGQLYVALGRVRERNNIRILVHRDKLIQNNKPLAKNVIIKELLL